MSPPVSLLVPAYNAARYLPRLVECMRAQTAPFAEWLLYDDASNDDTAALAASLGFRVLHGETNRGPAGARNQLLAAATQPWVHFQDADDLLEPTFLSRLLPHTEAADVVLCNMDWVGEATGTVEVSWRYDQAFLRSDPVSAAIRHPVGVICCLYRTAMLRSIGGFDETFRTWEDGDLHVRLAAAGARFQLVPEVLARGLRHDRGASNNTRTVLESRVRLLERYAVNYPGSAAMIGTEAEQSAIWLLERRRDEDLVDRLLSVCRAVRWRVPSSRNPLLRLLRPLLPAKAMIRLQLAIRHILDHQTPKLP